MKEQLEQCIQTACEELRIEGLAVPEHVDVQLELAENVQHGDYTTNLALRLAKVVGISPREFAEKLAEKMRSSVQAMGVKQVDVAGPGFLNMTLADEAFPALIATILERGHKYGTSKNHLGKKLVLEFFQPNIAKPLHVGHLRSAVIGHALYNLYVSQGYEVITDTHYGDWGVQFGILLNAFLRLSHDEREEILDSERAVERLNEVYVAENARIEVSPELREEGKAMFAKLEQGDAFLQAYWKRFVEVSMRTYPPVLDWLGVPEFTLQKGESEYTELMPYEVKEALRAGAVQEGAAVYMDLEDVGKGRCYLVKSDGSTTYHLRDVATLRYREQAWDLEKNVYVVGVDQRHHFEQLFEVGKRLGIALASRSLHVMNGLMRLPEGKFSTRKGNIIRLQALFQETEERVLMAIKEKHPELEKKEDVAHDVAVGVLKWWDLSHDHRTDLQFTWDAALSFEGNTGPYMQYAIARIKSILRKARARGFDEGVSVSQEHAFVGIERELVRALLGYQSVVQSSAERSEPHHVCTYLFSVAQLFNRYYSEIPILVEQENNPTLFHDRCLLLLAVEQVLENGLLLLGIPIVEEM